MIKGVIFDVGGVLHTTYDWRKDIAEAFGASLARTSQAMGEPLESFRKGKIDEDEFWRRFSENIGTKVLEGKNELWIKGFREHIRPHSQVIELARGLGTEGVKTAVLSNTIRPHLEIIRESGIYDLFDIKIFSCEVGLSKPQPEIYSYTLDKIEVDPESCIYIDDSVENLLPAKKLGMKTVLAEEPNQVVRDVKRVM